MSKPIPRTAIWRKESLITTSRIRRWTASPRTKKRQRTGVSSWKYIGRAILKKEGNSYLKTWEIDFTERENREKLSHFRDMRLEMRIEKECNRILESAFSFRVVIVKSKEERMGLRKRLVGTLSGCAFCRASDSWLVRHSPVDKIRWGKLWNVHHLGSDGLTDTDMERIVPPRGGCKGLAGVREAGSVRRVRLTHS